MTEKTLRFEYMLDCDRSIAMEVTADLEATELLELIQQLILTCFGSLAPIASIMRSSAKNVELVEIQRMMKEQGNDDSCSGLD